MFIDVKCVYSLIDLENLYVIVYIFGNIVLKDVCIISNIGQFQYFVMVVSYVIGKVLVYI